MTIVEFIDNFMKKTADDIVFEDQDGNELSLTIADDEYEVTGCGYITIAVVKVKK